VSVKRYMKTTPHPFYIRHYLPLPGKNESFTIAKDTILPPISSSGKRTCVIKPGTTLNFQGMFKFIVRGYLIASAPQTSPHLHLRGPCARPQPVSLAGTHGVLSGKKKPTAYLPQAAGSRECTAACMGIGPGFDSCNSRGPLRLYCTKKGGPSGERTANSTATCTALSPTLPRLSH